MIHCILHIIFFWPRLGDNFSKTAKAQYSQCGWGCPGPFDDPAECGFGWGWGRKALFQIWRIFKKTIRFLHVNVMWWLLLRAVFTKPCVYWVCLSLLVFVFRYSFATSLQTSVMCMAIMLSLTFGDCRSLLMSHEAVHTSMFSWEQDKPSRVTKVSCLFGRSNQLVFLSSCRRLGSTCNMHLRDAYGISPPKSKSPGLGFAYPDLVLSSDF